MPAFLVFHLDDRQIVINKDQMVAVEPLGHGKLTKIYTTDGQSFCVVEHYATALGMLEIQNRRSHGRGKN